MQGLEPRSQETFDLFISYAHADDADGHVSRFVELLRQVRDTQRIAPGKSSSIKRR